MDVHEVLPFLTNDASMSMRTASKMMGRTETFLATTRQKKSVPSLATIVRIADVYGYDVILRNRVLGDEIVIDLPNE